MARRTLIGALTAATLGMPGLGLAATEDADIVQREPMSDRQCSMFRALSRMVPAGCVNPSQSGRIDTKGRLKIGRQRSTIGGPTSGRDDVVEQSKPPPGYLVIEEIQFDFDSDRLAQSARAVLDDLARVIKHSINHRVAFVVEGHADAVGQADYNQSLSERRAAEVARYLATDHGIGRRRISWTGMGERALADRVEPGGAKNRRVVIKTLMHQNGAH